MDALGNAWEALAPSASSIDLLYEGTDWTSLCPHPPRKENARQGIELLTSRPVGTVSEYAAGDRQKKPWVSEGNGITVNPDSDDRGKDAVTMNLNIASTAFSDITGESEVAQKPNMTGNSDMVKGSTEEIDIQILQRKVQEMNGKYRR